MDTSLPTGRSGRIAALGIAVILLGLLWLTIASPILSLYQGRAEATQRQVMIATHMDALAAELPVLRDQAANAAENEPSIKPTIEGSSDAVAAASLQTMLQEMASSTGANLSSIENVPPENAGAYRRVGLKLSFDASWPTLVKLMAAIDRANPSMLIDDLEIHASPVRQPNQPVMLDVAFTVYALRAAASGAAPS